MTTIPDSVFPALCCLISVASLYYDYYTWQCFPCPVLSDLCSVTMTTIPNSVFPALRCLISVASLRLLYLTVSSLPCVVWSLWHHYDYYTWQCFPYPMLSDVCGVTTTTIPDSVFPPYVVWCLWRHYDYYTWQCFPCPMLSDLCGVTMTTIPDSVFPALCCLISVASLWLLYLTVFSLPYVVWSLWRHYDYYTWQCFPCPVLSDLCGVTMTTIPDCVFPALCCLISVASLWLLYLTVFSLPYVVWSLLRHYDYYTWQCFPCPMLSDLCGVTMTTIPDSVFTALCCLISVASLWLLYLTVFSLPYVVWPPWHHYDYYTWQCFPCPMLSISVASLWLLYLTVFSLPYVVWSLWRHYDYYTWQCFPCPMLSNLCSVTMTTIPDSVFPALCCLISVASLWLLYLTVFSLPYVVWSLWRHYDYDWEVYDAEFLSSCLLLVPVSALSPPVLCCQLVTGCLQGNSQN